VGVRGSSEGAREGWCGFKAIERRWLRAIKGLAHVGATESGIQNLAALAAQVEVLLVELFASCAPAAVNTEDFANVLRKEIFSPESIACMSVVRKRRSTRTFATYTYKHVPGHPSLEYEIGEKLGSGSFGVVWNGRHKRTGIPYAIKSVKKASVDAVCVWNEVETMKGLDHPHIMRMFATFEDDEHIYLALELCSGGAFFDALTEAGRISEFVAARLFKQVIGVVGYLHSRQVAHRDVKSENFLVLTKQPSIGAAHLKLSDFGTAKNFESYPLVTKVCTPAFVAPEVLTKDAVEYTEKVDVWSCGVMLYQIISGRLPFTGKSDLELLRRVKKGEFDFNPPEIWRDIPDYVKQFLRTMICVDVQDRCSADQAFRHEWVKTEESAFVDESIYRKLMEQIHRFHTGNRLKRVALRIIAQQIGDDTVDSLRNIFLNMDCDNKGSLNRYKMWEGTRLLDISEMTHAGMVETMCQLDPTGEGNVEYTEFLAATMCKEHYLKEDVCRSAFDRLDGDKDGLISRRDLGRLVDDKDGIRDTGLLGTSLGELINEVERIMTADEDQNGGISFDEFMTLMEYEAPVCDVVSAVDTRRKRGHDSYTEKDFTSLGMVIQEQDLETTSLNGSEDDTSSCSAAS